MNSEFEAKLKILKKGYLEKLKELISSFKILSEEDEINVSEIYSKVHTISGTSGMYGLSNISDISTEFEIYLKPIREDASQINSEELKTKLLAYINHLETAIIGE